MDQPRMHMTPSGPVNGIEVNLDTMRPWNPVVTQVRDAILKGWVAGSQGIERLVRLPPEGLAAQPTQEDVELTAELCETAARAGRLIDFGDWTQDAIKHGGNRGGPLYTKSVIGHPFRQPYVFMHTWEGETSVYLVNVLEPDKAAGDCEVVELTPMTFGGGSDRVLMIGDRVMLEPHREDGGMEWQAADPRKYYARAIPSIWRFMPGADAVNNGMAPANAAAGNALDPLMLGLLMLNTRGIVRETVETPPKLARARAKAGKEPIPSYDRVMSAPYVTAITARKAKGRVSQPRGGTHASPVPHLRMGHPRTYANGVTTLVRDALVNVSEEARKAWMSGRSHYAVKP